MLCVPGTGEVTNRQLQPDGSSESSCQCAGTAVTSQICTSGFSSCSCTLQVLSQFSSESAFFIVLERNESNMKHYCLPIVEDS